MKIRTAVLLFLIFCLFAGCGGSGGSGGSKPVPNFRGTWTANMRTESNDCDSSLVGTTELATYIVTQSGTNITVNTPDGGDGILGTVNSDDSFFAAADSPLESCTVHAELRFTNLEGNTADITLKADVDCGSAGKCSVTAGPSQGNRAGS